MRERPCSLLNFLVYDAVPDSHAVGGRKSGCRSGNGGGPWITKSLLKMSESKMASQKSELCLIVAPVSQSAGVCLTDGSHGGKQALVLSAFLSCEAALWKAASPSREMS